MKRRPRSGEKPSIKHIPEQTPGKIGLVFSGGGSRAAYQVGAIKALKKHLESTDDPISVVIGSSIGAVNGILLASGLSSGLDASISNLETLWLNRTFKNTFAGSPSRAFLKAVKLAALHAWSSSASPNATDDAIFNPQPLINAIDDVLALNGKVTPENFKNGLEHVAVMTTVEGPERKPLLFHCSHERFPTEMLHGASFSVHHSSELNARHGFASAALPSILPPVELDTDAGKVKLVDGGISQNVPVDPAVRLGADKIIVCDVSGRDWWFDHYGEPHDTRPTWEVPAAIDTFCLRPPEIFISRVKKPLGPLLKQAVGQSNKDFISSLGATWPLFTLLKSKMGEDLAYEVMSYVALHPDYAHALIERGYNETTSLLRKRDKVEFKKPEELDLAI